MFSGLRSRWTKPASCNLSKPRKISTSMRTSRPRGTPPLFADRSTSSKSRSEGSMKKNTALASGGTWRSASVELSPSDATPKSASTSPPLHRLNTRSSFLMARRRSDVPVSTTTTSTRLPLLRKLPKNLRSPKGLLLRRSSRPWTTPRNMLIHGGSTWTGRSGRSQSKSSSKKPHGSPSATSMSCTSSEIMELSEPSSAMRMEVSLREAPKTGPGGVGAGCAERRAGDTTECNAAARAGLDAAAAAANAARRLRLEGRSRRPAASAEVGPLSLGTGAASLNAACSAERMPSPGLARSAAVATPAGPAAKRLASTSAAAAKASHANKGGAIGMC
mmetsp:Transcript_59714/g.172326  ORF Transcript_59714/g.172326 Transcript_59714/m.172326 type:complete len:333 (+) Transcript_59714:826-1824(+)